MSTRIQPPTPGRPPDKAPPGEASLERRPWGRFAVVHEGPAFKVKQIVVDPGGRLSLQTHARRAEHWVIVAGRAEVRLGEEDFILERGASVDIPVGAIHRLSNPTATPLEVIEVQFGEYLGEDDIVRLEDIYDRA